MKQAKTLYLFLLLFSFFFFYNFSFGQTNVNNVSVTNFNVELESVSSGGTKVGGVKIEWYTSIVSGNATQTLYRVNPSSTSPYEEILISSRFLSSSTTTTVYDTSSPYCVPGGGCFYQYKLITKAGNSVFPLFAYISFIDSSASSLTTQKPAPYFIFSGYPISATAIKLEVDIKPRGTNVEKSTIYTWEEQIDLYVTSSLRFFYDVKNLSPSTSYCYGLKVKYSFGGVSGEISSSSTPLCIQTFGLPSKDAPSNLNAFANSDKVVYLNWKDNSTTSEPYYFVIQRVKLTPQMPQNITYSLEQPDLKKIKVKINWETPASEVPVRGVLERSTSSVFKNNYLFDYDVYDSKSPSKVNVYKIKGGTTYIGGGTKEIIDEEGEELTKYYYRVRECSSFGAEGFYTLKGSNKKLMEGKTARPSYPCSSPSLQVLEVVTPPYYPSSLQVSKKGGNMTLTWYTNSLKASRTNIYKDGSLFATVNTPSNSYTTTTQNGSYEVENCGEVDGITYCSKKSTSVTVSFNQKTKEKSLASLFNSFFESVGDIFSTIASKLSGFISSVKNNIIGFWKKDFGVKEKFARIVEGATGSDIGSYFKQVGSTTLPYYKDAGLDADSVYLYRVLVRYENGMLSSSSLPVAVKTLTDVDLASGLPTENAPICIAYGVCDRSILRYNSSPLGLGRDPEVEFSESQCKVNADCGDVGRVQKTIQER